VTFTAGAGVDLNQLGPQAVQAANAQTVLEREAAIDAYRQTADIGEPVAEMIRRNTPVSKAEKREAELTWQRLQMDKEWVQRWMKGDRECRTQVALLSIIRGSPTLADS
jgi:hypothetical protein